MSDEAAEIKKVIEAKFAIAETGDYYKLLGLSEGAGATEVRKAYFSLVKMIHPDQLPKHGLQDMVSRTSKLFQVVTTAY